MIDIINGKGEILYCVEKIAGILKVSYSTTRRILLKLECKEEVKYNNKLYYSQNSLFQAMEMKLKNELRNNGL